MSSNLLVFAGHTPSGAARLFTKHDAAVNRDVPCALDVWYNISQMNVEMHLIEQAADGSWGYMGGTTASGILWSLPIDANPIVGIGPDTFQEPQGSGVTGFTGTFAQIVADEGANNMVYPFCQTIADHINARFPVTGTATPPPTQSTTDPRTVVEQSAQHSIAVALTTIVIATPSNAPVTVNHP